VFVDVGERLKVKCPTCGIQGFIEQRGNSYRIKHYVGYDGNQRKYLIHKLNEDYIDSMGINGNQNMGINNPNLGSFSESLVRSLGFGPKRVQVQYLLHPIRALARPQ
jgi:hypothetical protein